ncbi:uncharacterized protein K02A2.6 [Trichonephila clavipes]|nr:uncharacterized protein K02A2.6 [Trichonephila clavipes]
MYPLWIIVGRSGQGKVLPQEDWIPGCHSAIAYDTKSHPKHTDCKFVRPSGNSAYSHEQHSRGKFPNALSPLHRYCNSTCLTKCWSAGSPDLSPIEQVRNIIGRQLQQHTQPAPNSPVLTQQVQQACNSIQQNDIWHNVCTLPDWPAIKAFRAKTEQNLNNLLREYKDIFDDKLGEINNYEAKLKLRHGVKPIFCRVRTVPFALKGRVENEIDRLEKEGIIEKVDSSEWATPVVPVVKSDGSIRLCADYSVTLNPNLVVPQHPLPRLDEIFGSLNGGKQFTKLDFKHAYLQMKVHPDSQKLMTINTHKGLYICKRLMYGLNGAPAIWQRYVDGLFQGMDGVKVFMDDARITGSDEISPFTALEEFLRNVENTG